MSKFRVEDVFNVKGKIFPLFGGENKDLFDRPGLLACWEYGEFGQPSIGLCLRSELDFHQAKLTIIQQVINEKRIRVGNELFHWEEFDLKKMPHLVLEALRTEIKKRTAHLYL